MKKNHHNLLLHRTFQYLGIILIVGVIGGGYWYWKQAQAGVTQKTANGQGLVGYWSFDEGTGTQAGDASGNGNTGTLTNSPTWVDGRLGKGIDFNGTSGVSVNHSTSLDNWGAQTVSLWFKMSAPQSRYARLIEKGSNSEWTINTNYSGSDTKITVQQLGSGTARITTAAEYGDGKWHYLTLTIAGNYVNAPLALFIDGVDVGNATTPSTASVQTGNLNIGGISGSIDETRIYNRALGATEIASLYQLGATKLQKTQSSDLTNGLVGYWPFNGKDISGTTAYDRSTSGNNGTLTNGPTITEGRTGQAFSFDGTDDYVSLGTTSTAFNFASDLSGSAWIRTGTDGRFIMGYQNANPIIYMAVGPTTAGGTANKFVVYLRTDSGLVAVFSSSKSVTDNVWHHVAFTRDTTAQKVRLYVDGTLDIDATYTDTGSINTSGSSNHAVSANAPYTFNGSIDEVRVYNRALSTSEIWDLYQMGNPDKVNSADSQIDPLEKGIVGYWKLDDASGTSASDSSGNANTGTLTNGPTWTSGQIGGATNFDGTDDYINAGTGASLSLTGNFSLSAWINPSSYHTTGYFSLKNGFVGRGPAGTFNYALQATDATTISFIKRTSSEGLIFYDFTGIPTLTNQWTLVSAIVSGSTITLYINGRYFGAQSIGTIASVAGDVLYLGTNIPGNSECSFTGKLDEVRIYNRALSSEEVAKLYRITAPDNPDTGLVGYWPFNGPDISGTTAYDRSGKGNTGTLTNGPTITEGKAGQGMRFDGTDDYIALNVPSARTNIITVSAWIKPTSVSTRRDFVASGDSLAFATNNWILSIRGNTGGVGAISVLGNVTTLNTAAAVVSENVWAHTAFTSDGTTVKIYVNGILAASGTLSLNSGSTYGEAIGRSPSSGSSSYFPGAIDEPRIYNRVLSANEITALYNAGR